MPPAARDGRKSQAGKPSLVCCCCPLSFVCCSQKSRAEAQRNKSLRFSTQYCLKRNTRAAATTAGRQDAAATTGPAKEGGKRENQAAAAAAHAAAAAAACVLVLPAETGIFFACGKHNCPLPGCCWPGCRWLLLLRNHASVSQVAGPSSATEPPGRGLVRARQAPRTRQAGPQDAPGRSPARAR